ncbi:MAG: hypothetical protein EON90_05460 [Brevundimonas sp.]|nr:MAG: hypothetical protein EON90_05460 [Brevundimonas sp.]
MRGALTRGSAEGDAGGLSGFFLRFGVVAALIGMLMGVAMGVSEDFRLATAHAHLNLLGWVSMTLYGLFYRVSPASSEGCLPAVQAVCAVAGAGVFVASLGLKLVGPPALAHAAALGLMVGPALVVTGMGLFALIVFQGTRRAA